MFKSCFGIPQLTSYCNTGLTGALGWSRAMLVLMYGKKKSSGIHEWGISHLHRVFKQLKIKSLSSCIRQGTIPSPPYLEHLLSDLNFLVFFLSPWNLLPSPSLVLGSPPLSWGLFRLEHPDPWGISPSLSITSPACSPHFPARCPASWL